MTALRNVAAIFGKEWRHYFGSPIAWVALFVWTLLFGIFYYFAFTFFLEQSMRVAQQGMEYGGGMKLSLNEYMIRPLFHNMAVVALFVAPMLTMRLFAEEKRQGTIELLMTLGEEHGYFCLVRGNHSRRISLAFGKLYLFING